MSGRAAAADRPMGPASKVVGLYQTLLRRVLEHFFPDAILDSGSDRSMIQLVGEQADEYRVLEDTEGFGLIIEWLGTRFQFQPGNPTPFLPSEVRLVQAIVRLLDARFQALFDAHAADREEMFHYALEDFVVTLFLAPPDPMRIPAALEALRVAALSTYENRRVSSGALLLGTPDDPAQPGKPNTQGAPRYNIRLTAIKGFHRLCDGLNTVYLVDRHGDLLRAVDIARWAQKVQGSDALEVPCPRPYVAHAKATKSGDHICLVLTPSHEIKVFAGGVMAFSFSDARWRLLDIPSKFDAWRSAIGASCCPELADKIFQAAINLSEARQGALFVVVRDPVTSGPQLIAPADRIQGEIAMDDPEDPDNLSPRLAKRSLHHVVRGQDLTDLDASILEALAGIDGAVVFDRDGTLLTFGAILRINAESLKVARAVEGARTLAALAASYHGPVLKVSEDGLITMFLSGRRVWDL